MEFEKNTPASAQDIALADTPKVTLQPVSSNVRAEAVMNNYSHQNEAAFEFETESTGTPAAASTTSHSHHKVALISAVLCATLFGAALYVLLSNR
ncbi:MAG: hypothetical protein V4678_00690 [Patescibacteria group bacterium]